MLPLTLHQAPSTVSATSISSDYRSILFSLSFYLVFSLSFFLSFDRFSPFFVRVLIRFLVERRILLYGSWTRGVRLNNLTMWSLKLYVFFSFLTMWIICNYMIENLQTSLGLQLLPWIRIISVPIHEKGVGHCVKVAKWGFIFGFGLNFEYILLWEFCALLKSFRSCSFSFSFLINLQSFNEHKFKLNCYIYTLLVHFWSCLK